MVLLNKESLKVLVSAGASQTNVRFEVATVLQQMRDRAQYIQISGNGSNALDFHIALYIGEIVARDPQSFFHIVPKDGGFDPLVHHRSGRSNSSPHQKAVAE